MRRRAPLIYLSETATPEQKEEILRAAPGAVIVDSAGLEADPGLVSRVEVCYSELTPTQWGQVSSLQWLQVKWAGVEHLLGLPAVQAHPAVITNVHIHARAMSEHLWGLALMLTRNLHGAVIRQHEGAWDESLKESLATVAGKTLCVAGLGTIGEQCALIGKALGMRVIGIRRRPSPNGAADEVVGPERRQEVFAESRIIMLVLPDTRETRAFAGREELAAMRGAFLINGGRGKSVDTAALVDALAAGSVRGAGLDVTDPEPLPAGHPLWKMPNVIITPHYAGNHPGYDREAFAVFVDNLGRWMRGEPLRSVVDRAGGY
ncbi:MAG TPA: D-2-hydroxyacid dehydrogenase [Spirochaetia bacterium]|nr:D-2-hydroxyacid dehydrogenase [Spirochaetia bacterium]